MFFKYFVTELHFDSSTLPLPPSTDGGVEEVVRDHSMTDVEASAAPIEAVEVVVGDTFCPSLSFPQSKKVGYFLPQQPDFQFRAPFLLLAHKSQDTCRLTEFV